MEYGDMLVGDILFELFVSILGLMTTVVGELLTRALSTLLGLSA